MVVTNIPLNVDRICLVYGEGCRELIQLVKTEFGDYGSQRPFSVPGDFTCYEWRNGEGQGPLFVVDEAHLCIGRDAKKEVLEYLSMHGHYGHDIIVLTQNPRKLHRDLKDMVEVSWRTVKQSVYGEDTGYYKKTYHGVSSRNADFVHEEEREYDPAFFPFYQSHTLSKSAVSEAVSHDIKAAKSPYRKLSIAMITVGVVFMIYTGQQIFGGSDVEAVEVEPPEVEQVQPGGHEALPVNHKVAPVAHGAPSVDDEALSVPTGGYELSAGDSSSIDVAETRNQVEYERRRRRSVDFHPYYKVRLHIDSTASYMEDGRLVRMVYFAASQNGQKVFDMRLPDLILAGYDVEVYGDCSVHIRYMDYEDFITCDAPTQEVFSDKAQLAAN